MIARPATRRHLAMGIHEHKKQAKRAVACGVVTISDSRDLQTDESGTAIASALEAAGHRVVTRLLVRDDPDAIAGAVSKLAARNEVDAVITNGGTGLSPRDNTYETLVALFDRHMDGFGELFRMLSYEQIGPAAMLSRAAAGLIGDTPVFMLPGSTAACRLALERLIVPELGHLVSISAPSKAGGQ